MKITILNGNPEEKNAHFDGYINMLSNKLQTESHVVELITLRDLDIKYCVGCFGCWVKKPGECVTPDDSHRICETIINSDFLLWTAPMRMGFPSALLKKMMDKSIPLIHPYFVVEYNEAHHRPRYDSYPRIGLLVQKEEDTDSEDLGIVSDIFSRTAVNMKSHLEFSFTMDHPVDEVAQAIQHESVAPVPFHRNLSSIPGWSDVLFQHLTIFNGSPRGSKGNTPLMLEQVAKGFNADGKNTTEVHHLVRRNELDQQVNAFTNAEAVLFGFPLYTDAMPGLVKAFFEALAPLRKRTGNPPIGFLVQSGFPESAHSRHLERYLEKLAARLDSPYMGTIIKGGCEGVHMMPEKHESQALR